MKLPDFHALISHLHACSLCLISQKAQRKGVVAGTRAEKVVEEEKEMKEEVAEVAVAMAEAD